MRYEPAPGAGAGIEVLSFEELRRMDRARRRTRPQRPDFHVLALVRSGTGRHTADFVDHELGERSVVWIRPGVVHRWTDVDRLDGPLVLFEDEFLPAADSFAPVCRQLDEKSWSLAVRTADLLADSRSAPAPVRAHLLSALVLCVLPGEPAPPGGAGEHAVFRRYREAVEARFAQRHHVTDYAGELGYDVRTLTRATRAATGLGAKQFLDGRIALEAKRLLAHTELPVARCAERVGFDDAANFTTFFRRQTGLTPSRWRATLSGR
ncbi:AraC family transcriptional regulator [Streptomyces luteireticuli]|uniref:helix-turn-helix domain-containing protein n=1 Tax=Streptomyces luteireticuli TaxID=173858 RepID=UPI0031D9DD43